MDPGHFLSNIKWVLFLLTLLEVPLVAVYLVRTTLESFWTMYNSYFVPVSFQEQARRFVKFPFFIVK